MAKGLSPLLGRLPEILEDAKNGLTDCTCDAFPISMTGGLRSMRPSKPMIKSSKHCLKKINEASGSKTWKESSMVATAIVVAVCDGGPFRDVCQLSGWLRLLAGRGTPAVDQNVCWKSVNAGTGIFEPS